MTVFSLTGTGGAAIQMRLLPDKRIADLSGRTFGKLTVLAAWKRAGRRFLWECRCECGNQIFVINYNLLNGNTSSCGCHQRSQTGKANSTHGLSGSPEFRVWQGINQRCHDPNCISFKNYGARGITVCERWLEFAAFYEDMGPRPSAAHQIERDDNNGNYEPSNCRWATQLAQANNKRSNVRVAHAGRVLTISQWSRKLGVEYATLRQRLSCGWPIERALAEPVIARGNTPTLTYQGQTYTLAEWAAELGCNEDSLKSRLYRGWTADRILETPIRSYGRTPSA